MAWEARWGLKPSNSNHSLGMSYRLNGLGSPLGIETDSYMYDGWGHKWLNGLGSPLGIETPPFHTASGNTASG